MPNGIGTIPNPTSVLPEPSYAAQILTVAARVLCLGSSVAPVTPWSVHDALTTGEKAITATLPDAVRADASARARAMLPQIARTSCGEYAVRLADAARDL
ncbi:hypothetical protein L0F81_23845 [Streptomyces tricolor]|uniref:Uncharacterized protein n=1 Tax=Streptomyces tricolor TaxID=68277 RepID=A0ABS9JL78_9ACTN|nr:hypothetical protein [Streptomyces tricolor]MCG0066286.1 hypothetical protein [Streptomyces tricolor]